MNIIDKEIYKLTKKNKKFIIGYSGGIDSSVLLYSIKKIKNIYIKAIHINYNINKNSKKWEKHCINICNKFNIPIIIKNLYIKKLNNIENKLRKIRYKIYIKNIKNKEIILTAHHKNDQCETILLSLKRGSGLLGISGIKKKISIKKKIIIRPFLNIEKKDIKKYAIKNKIKWIYDNSNNDIKFDRNFLRKKIIPKLIKRWPFFLSCITRSAKICLNENKLINKLIKKRFKKTIIKKNILNLNYLLKLSKEEFYVIIRKWIKLNKKKMISYKLIKLIWININKNKNKIYLQMFFKEFLINIYKKKLYFCKKIKNIKNKIIWKNIKKKLLLPNKIGYLYISNNKKKNNKNLVRKPLKNEKIYIKFNIKNKIKITKKKKKKSKKYFKKIKFYHEKEIIYL